MFAIVQRASTVGLDLLFIARLPNFRLEEIPESNRSGTSSRLLEVIGAENSGRRGNGVVPAASTP